MENIVNEYLDRAYEKRMKSMTRYEREVFDEIIKESPQVFDNKMKLIDLVKVIKKEKITKKKLDMMRNPQPIEIDPELPF